jgi:hypothetical protein
MEVRYNQNGTDAQAKVMLASWPGVGSVGIGTIDFLRRQLGAEPIADLDLKRHFSVDGVLVEKGLIRAFADIPSHVFHLDPTTGIVLSQSEAQSLGKRGVEVMQAVVDLAEKLGIETILTAAALPMTVGHNHPPEVAVVANSERLLSRLQEHDVTPLQQGHISGMNGLLLGFAGARGIDAGCLLGGMPQYAANLPNPKATREIVRRLQKILNLDLNLEELDEAVEEMEGTMAEIEENIRTAFSQMDESGEDEDVLEGIADLPDLDEEDVPGYVMEKVERLFQEVQQERSQEKATQLKTELDRWNLYALYEDRFLSLFRK